MPTFAMLDLLAQVPESGIFVHPLKLVTIVVLFTLWVVYAQWVDKDTLAVNTYRTVWNMATVGGGLLAVILLLVLPFLLALAGFAVVNLLAAGLYVMHRNGLVVEEDKICTADHFKRLVHGQEKKERMLDVTERVRIVSAQQERLKVPDSNEERHTFALTQDLLFDALYRRANRLEIVPTGPASKVRVWVDGVAVDRDPIERVHGDSVVLMLKKAAGLDIGERRKPQKGMLEASIADHHFDIIVRTTGSTAGESMTLRILGDEKKFKISDLGFTEKQVADVREIMDADGGLVLLSAPPRAGLTTTAYSFARSHDAFLQNIQMLEYEREIEIENITQRVYELSEDKTFVDELQRLFRSDPDVVILPILKERAAAPVASKAAAKKQKVYVGIQSLDLFDALRRWAGLIGDSKLLGKSLKAVIHQRLVRKLCDACKAAYKPDPAMLKKISMPADKVLFRPPEPEYDKHGNPIVCPNCQGTGYAGRTAVFNMLLVDEELSEVIRNGGTLNDVKTVAMKKGGLGLQQFALQKVLDGVTSIEEIARATKTAKPSRASGRAKPAA